MTDKSVRLARRTPEPPDSHWTAFGIPHLLLFNGACLVQVEQAGEDLVLV